MGWIAMWVTSAQAAQRPVSSSPRQWGLALQIRLEWCRLYSARFWNQSFSLFFHWSQTWTRTCSDRHESAQRAWCPAAGNRAARRVPALERAIWPRPYRRSRPVSRGYKSTCNWSVPFRTFRVVDPHTAWRATGTPRPIISLHHSDYPLSVLSSLSGPLRLCWKRRVANTVQF